MKNNFTRFLTVAIILLSNTVWATNYYVSALTGNDSNNGLSETTAFQTLTKLSSGVNYGPGDIIYVMNGTYTSTAHDVLKITKQGTATQPITFKNYPGHTPEIDFDTWNAILITDGACYIVIDGMKIRGNNRNITVSAALNQPSSCANPTGTISSIYNGNGVNVDGGGTAPCHHITIRNCEIFECGGGGVSTSKCDYITIENNLVYKNAWYTVYGSSGISILGSYDVDSDTTNYKMIVRNNITHENRLYVPWKSPCKITDGNGIIYDTNNNSGSSPARPAYGGKALIENNVSYLNGGRGIECFKSGNLTIRNNTTYQNVQSTEITAGEIDINTASNVRVYNNIMYAIAGGKVNTLVASTNVTSDNNLMFNSTTYGFLNNNDRLGTDPLFNNPAAGDFTLKSNSPAINAGSKVVGQYAVTDILNIPRPAGTAPDIGAYEFTGTPTPPASSFTPGDIVALRIGDGTTALSTNASPVSVIEYNPAGTPSGTNLPLANTTSPNRIVISGANGNFDGQLSLSGDGRYLSAIGYDGAVGDAVTTFTAATKTIVRIGSDAQPNYSTKSSPSAAKPTSSVSDNGARFWSTGIGTGSATRISTFGATSSSYAMYEQFRSLGMFGGNLYTCSGTTVAYTGVDPTQPTSTNKINYPFPGFPVSGHSYQSFVLLDQDPAVGYTFSYPINTATPAATATINSGYDVLYCSDINLGLVKFYYNGTTWVFAGSFNPVSATGVTGGLYGITAKINKAGQIELYAVKGQASNNNIIMLIDGSGRTGNISNSVPTTSTVASAGANYIYKGVAFSPSSQTVSIPVIASVSPTHGVIGTPVVITGSNFSQITDVSFGGVPASSFTVVSLNTINAVVGAGSSGNITVTNVAGTGTISGFTYDAPAITSFTPVSANTATTVTITGNNFTGATSVTFGGVAAASFTVVSSTSITAVVAAGSASGNVAVTTPGGTASLAGFTFIPTPSITSFTPSSAAYGATVTITGTNLTGATAVTFGGTPAVSFNIVSSTTITAVVGAGTTGSVSVTTPGGSATSAGFSYAGPAITAFTPTTAATGATVTITGANLSGTTAVSFGGVPAALFNVVSATSITAVVAPNSSSGNVAVTSPGGTVSLSGFTFVPVPAITSFTPSSAPYGATVTITGSNLNGTTSVSFGGTPAVSFAVVSSTTVTAVAGAGTSGNITLVTPGGSATATGFTFAAPAITSFSPTTAVAGATVTITGTSLNGTTAVAFGGIPAASFNIVSPTSITAVVATGSASGNVTLTNPGGNASLNGFIFIPGPTITSFNPVNAGYGATVTITGTNLSTTTAVSFGGTPATSFTIISGSTINAVVGAGSNGNISVTGSGGSASLSGFTYLSPVISSFSPTSAATGTTVTIVGSNLLGTTAVNFGGTAAASFNVVSATTITAVIANGTSGAVSITNPSGNTLLNGFTYLPPQNNVNLQNLILSTGTLTPAFAKSVVSYSVSVPNATSSISVTPTVEDNTSTIKINGVNVNNGSASGNITLNVGSNMINILVTSVDGSTRSYSLNVTRAPGNIATLASLQLSQGLLTPAFSSSILNYTVNLSGSPTSVKVTPVTTDAAASIKVNGLALANGNTSAPIAINNGTNQVNVVVTAQDGVTVNNYVINFNLSNVQPGSDLFVHQALSPNGDGKNDFFLIEGIEKYENKVTVFNRFGTKVFTQANYNNTSHTFNGYSSNGDQLQEGSYFYLIEYTLNGDKKSKTGYLIIKK